MTYLHPKYNISTSNNSFTYRGFRHWDRIFKLFQEGCHLNIGSVKFNYVSSMEKFISHIVMIEAWLGLCYEWWI